MAAAYVTLLSYVAVALAVFIVSNRFHRQEVERLRLGLVMASGLGVLVLGTLVSGAAEATAVAARLVLIGGLAAFWYLFVLSDRERRRLQQLKGRFV
jgi:lipopolysaccharide export LptBFGC system permease protein LptF